MSNMVRTDLYLTKVEREKLKKLAQRQHISAAALTRTILDRALGVPALKVEPIKFADGSERGQ